MPTFVTSCTVKTRPDGERKLVLSDPRTYAQALGKFGDGEELVLTIEPAELPQSEKQQRGFHAMIQPWAKAEGHNVDDLKRDLLREVFGEREHVNTITSAVELVLREPHTSTLTRAQYSELIERTLDIGAGCGHVLVAPNEYRAWKAQRDQRTARKAGAA